MDKVLKCLEPKSVFKYFEEISQIPRGSGNEKAISDYLVSFANENKLEVFRDQYLNVIIKKPAYKGYEDAPTLILQGHMDMVCEKNKHTLHDFQKDPLKLKIVNDMIYDADTTLGADNGIAVAMALAVLEADDIPHPAIEAVITSDEEVSMSGAMNLDTTPLNGKMLINLDSEEEGYLLVSSAGGTKARLSMPIECETPDIDMSSYRISIGGLRGGHSGAEIDKGRGNANRLLGRLLNNLSSDFSFRIAEINGGLKSNAITREAEVIIYINPAQAAKLTELLKGWNEVFKNELSATDPDLHITIEAIHNIERKAFTKNMTERVIAALVMLPNGIQSMNMHIKGLVESSSNLGVVKTTSTAVELVNEIRSSVKTLKTSILKQVELTGKVLGCKLTVDSDYPEWEYNPDSRLRKHFHSVYTNKYGVEPQIIALHAGLECGVLSNKIEGLDCISLGPNLYDVHTPDEHLSIPSTKNVWEYLLEALKQAKHI